MRRKIAWGENKMWREGGRRKIRAEMKGAKFRRKIKG